MSVGNRQVVVVDDEELMRTLLSDFFSSQGYRVRCYSTGAAALKSLQEDSIPAAVVADIRMIPMSGMDLLKKVKKDFPSLPVVLFTSAGNPEERDEALRSGASDYFTKPFALSDLRSVVERVSGNEKTKRKA